MIQVRFRHIRNQVHYPDILAMVLLTCFFSWMSCVSLAQSVSRAPCISPSKDETAAVYKYVLTKYHLNQPAELTHVEDKEENQNCYWKYTFEIPAQHRILHLYLSPDRQYLSASLYDINKDPLLEERLKFESINRSLLSDKSPRLGSDTVGGVSIVVFSDFQCPFCKRLASSLEREILPHQKDVAIVYKAFPLPFHSWAREAALAASCASAESDSTFWQLHDYLFEHQGELNKEAIDSAVQQVVIQLGAAGKTRFQSCLASGSGSTVVDRDIRLGKSLGVTSTPVMFINGKRVNGAIDLNQLSKLIREVMEHPGENNAK